MEASVRTILEQFATTSVAATVSIDTDNESPPTFSGLVTKLVKELEIGPSVSDQSLVLSDASALFLLLSDTGVGVKLKTGETVLSGVRMLLIAGTDETSTALPAQTALLSGNGTTTAKVQVFAFAKV